MEFSAQAAIIIGLIIYKLACLLVGIATCYMGYRLFLAGVKPESSDASLTWKGMVFSLKRGAPGTFFALFGAVIISVTVWKGFRAGVTKASGAPVTQIPEKENNVQLAPNSHVAETR